MSARPQLSQDARSLAGCVWGLPIGSKTKLSYRRPNSIWPRTRSALTELVEAGIISETRDNEGLTFAALHSCREFLRDAKRGKGLLLSPMPEDAPTASHGGGQ